MLKTLLVLFLFCLKCSLTLKTKYKPGVEKFLELAERMHVKAGFWRALWVVCFFSPAKAL